MSDKFPGEQLTGQELYNRQKRIRSSSDYSCAPAIVADCLQISENIGSVLRLADAAGSNRVIFISEPDDQNINRVRRTSRNCDALVDWQFSTYEQFESQDMTNLDPLIAVELTTCSKSIFETNLPVRCSFIIGNERHGISSRLLAQCHQAVHIPMYGVNGSMNVTHALAIVLFEWRRQHSTLACHASV